MSKSNYDVVIVGAGFAGLTAARELSRRGYDTLILEGRDRRGGRTWVDRRMGRDLEMGGTYVHWFQPHVWAEISRYNLEVVKVPKLNESHWIADGKLISGSQQELFEKVGAGMKIFLEDTLKYFPRPYEPFHNEKEIRKIDHLSVADRLREIESRVDKETIDLLSAYWSAYFCTTDLSIPGLTQAYRWAALAENDWKILEDIFELYKFKNGTRSLIDSIYNDSDAELRLSTPVSIIEKTGDGYKVTTRNGDEISAKAVIAAVPINVINNIKFKPGLPEEVIQIANEKQTTRDGGKLWAKVRGVTDTALLTAPNLAVTSAHVDTLDGDIAYIMGYVSNKHWLDVDDPQQVQELLRNWLPDVEVIESTGHKWAEDEFSLGTWPVLRKNQLTRYGKAFRNMDDGLYFAGSDYADGWAGFMDGAIESGMKTSTRVESYLRERKLVLK